MAYITYLIVQICFQNFMPLKRIVFQRQRKFSWKNKKRVSSHTYGGQDGPYAKRFQCEFNVS